MASTDEKIVNVGRLDRFLTKCKALFAKKSDAIKSITRNGTTFTATRADDTTFTFTQQDSNTWNAMGGATSSAAGTAGYVPAPPKDGYNTKYLRADGSWVVPPNDNTKNTAGSTDTSSKIFLIGATSQAANPQTYSHDTAYVGTDGCLYSGGTKVLTAHQDISGKKNTQSAVSDPTASGNSITFIDSISQNAQGVITPTKKTVRDASTTQAGVVQLNDTLTSDSTSQALTANQGKVLKASITALVANEVFYGTCATAAATQQKECSIDGITTLAAGLKLCVKFTNAQTYNGQPTLKINSLAAKSIVRFGTTAATRYEWQAGEVLNLMYDGSNWIIVGGALANGDYPGNVKLSDNYTSSAGAASAGMGASSKAVYDAYTSLNDHIATKTISESDFLTAPNGITISEFAGCISGNVVNVCFKASKSSNLSQEYIAYVKSPYRPKIKINGIYTYNSDIVFYKNGDIYVYPKGAQTELFVNVTYAV